MSRRYQIRGLGTAPAQPSVDQVVAQIANQANALIQQYTNPTQPSVVVPAAPGVGQTSGGALAPPATPVNPLLIAGGALAAYWVVGKSLKAAALVGVAGFLYYKLR